MQSLFIFTAAAAIIAMLLLPTTGDSRLDACLDAGFTPEHCRAWSANQ